MKTEEVESALGILKEAETVDGKICTVCAKFKKIDQFYKNRASKDGRMFRCIDCQKVISHSDANKNAQKRYSQSAKGKAAHKKHSSYGVRKTYCQQYQKEYEKTETRKRIVKRYRQSAKGKAAQKRFRQSGKGKAAQKKHGAYAVRKKYYQQYEKTDVRKRIVKRYRQSDKRKAVQKRYRQSGKGKVADKKAHAIRRAKKTQAGGSYTALEWFELCKFYDFLCLKCGDLFPFVKLTVDHIKPISKGGTSFIHNLQPLCLDCNRIKGNQEIDYRKLVPN